MFVLICGDALNGAYGPFASEADALAFFNQNIAPKMAVPPIVVPLQAVTA